MYCVTYLQIDLSSCESNSRYSAVRQRCTHRLLKDCFVRIGKNRTIASLTCLHFGSARGIAWARGPASFNQILPEQSYWS